MTPASLASSQFANYRPLARQTALANLNLLQKLPPALVPFLLREIISFDWKFPAERDELFGQFAYLKSLSPDRLNAEMAGFNRLHLSAPLETSDWVKSPELFVEQFSAFLWSSGQMDPFRASSEQYMRGFRAAHPESEPAVPRVVLVLFGAGADAASYKLFRKLRRRGTYFSALAPGNHLPVALDFLAARSTAHLDPYAHWLVDGSAASAPGSAVSISYDALAGLRSKLTAEISAAFVSHSSPEALRTKLAGTTPAELGMSTEPRDELLNRFKVSLFTEGSGTQIYSTTFVQWTTREALRRARPLTLVARFTPRRRETSMQEMLTGTAPVNYDPAGSLLDGDMGAWYTWIELQRLPGSKKSVLIACLEGRNQAVAVGPSFPPASENHSPMSLQQLLKS